MDDISPVAYPNVVDSTYAALKDGLKPLYQPVSRNTHQAGSVLLVPEGMKEVDVKAILDRHLPAPERRSGITNHTDLSSFIDYVNRFKSAPTVVFARNNRAEPKLLALFNHHPEGGDESQAGHGDHRALYHFPLSDEWKVWQGKNKTMMTQGEFAEFVEERFLDIVPPATEMSGDTGEVKLRLAPDVLRLLAATNGRCATPAEMFALSRGLRVHAEDQVEQKVDLQSGEGALVYRSEHKNEAGEKVNVPQLFQIGIPVFDRGPAYVMVARLRYRIAGGSVKWSYHLHRADLVFDDAFNEAVARTRSDAEVPVFIGTL